MTPRPQKHAAAALLAGALATATPLAAQAQAATAAWRWEGTLYLWLPAVGGETSFPTDGTSVDITAEQVIDALKALAMGSLSAKKGPWGAWTDLAYADFGARKDGVRDFGIGGRPLPGSVGGQFELDLKATAWTLAGTYGWSVSPAHEVDLLGGVRMLDLSQKLNWSLAGDIAGTGLPGRDGASSASLQNWDAIVGIRGRAFLDGERRWFLPFHLDVGTGESDRTWQAQAGIGYRFDWGALVASYRYLGYEMKPGEAIHTMNLGGWLVGLGFQW